MEPIAETLDQIDFGESAYNPLTGVTKFLAGMFALSLLLLVVAVFYSSGLLSFVIGTIALVPIWSFFAHLRRRLGGIWQRHYYSLMYLWSGSCGAVNGMASSGAIPSTLSDDFEMIAAFFLGLAFPRGSTNDYAKVVSITKLPIFSFYKEFGVLNPKISFDDPRMLETEKFCADQEIANPDLIRLVKLLALIIYKREGREGASKYLANWGNAA